MSDNVEIKFRRFSSEVQIPTQANSTDAGYDIFAINDGVISEDGNYIEYRTGLFVQPPTGYHIEIYPRSSISKYNLILANSVGIIDEGYRGEILVRFKYIPSTKSGDKIYKSGDRIGQLVVKKTIRSSFVESHTLEVSERGTGGFGSTGR